MSPPDANAVRALSSAQTFLNKVLVPGVIVPLTGVGTLLMWVGPTGGPPAAPPPEVIRWLLTALWLVGSAVGVATGVGLKRVRLAGPALLVSNYRREISVPVASIVAIEESRWVAIHPVTLRLREQTRFGRSIRFMPAMRGWGHWRPHPVVAELAALAGIVSHGRVAAPDGCDA